MKMIAHPLNPLTRAKFMPPMLVLSALALLALVVGGGAIYAQIAGDRGIAPVVDTGDIEVDGVNVDTQGKTALEARDAGWKAAYRAAWAKINGPQLDDGALAALVSQVVVEHEQIGPHRYQASLGIVFDRARTSEFTTGAGGQAIHRSAPMLLIPVLYSGGVAQVYEIRGAWQRAWAEFRTGASAINYVRPSGVGGDSLLITAGQPGRRSRLWWHGILSAFGASDVLIAQARLERQWPGGPVRGLFTARYGPDNRFLQSFTLTASDPSAVPAMLAQAVQHMDQLYANALASGTLGKDQALSIDHPAVNPGLARLIALGQHAQAQDAAAQAAELAAAGPAPVATGDGAGPAIVPHAGYAVQFSSLDASAVDEALGAVRAIPGVGGATTTSIAIGGTSVMRVSYGGSISQLATALRQRGWEVVAGSAALRIRRAGH